MTIIRSTYKDGTYEEAKASGYDIIQLKYDGHFCICVAEGNHLTYISDTNRVFKEEDLPCPDGTYVGEFMRGTQWSKAPDRTGKYFIYDLLEDGQLPIGSLPYKERYLRLRARATEIPPLWQYVQLYRMQTFPVLWKEFIEGKGFEGVVFHKSNATAGSELLRCKRVFTLEGVVVDMKEGQGKHSGRLGSLIVMSGEAKVTIGSGFSDEEREEIWLWPHRFTGKTLEYEANAKFKSGNVRHARFVRWRPDKDRIVIP